MSKIKISIIVPVFNVEDYIEACLNSIITQSYNGEIECILIDDCGNDRSMEIAKKIISNYNGDIEFRILCHDKNKGLSAARNTGVKNANGSYLLFLDSDDELAYNAIINLTAPLKEALYDVIVGNYELIGHGNFDRLNICEDIRLFDVNQIFNAFISKSIYEMAWNKLVRRDFFIYHNLWFAEGLLHEDNLWSFFLFLRCESLAVVVSPSYRYRVRENSIMGNRGYKNALHLIEIFHIKSQFIKEQDLYKKYPKLVTYMLNQQVSLLKQCIINKFNKNKFTPIQREISIWYLSLSNVTISTIFKFFVSKLPYSIFKSLIILHNKKYC